VGGRPAAFAAVDFLHADDESESKLNFEFEVRGGRSEPDWHLTNCGINITL
jgi:hypothetical protein